MAKKNPNLALWNSVCVTDPDCTKEVSYGKRKFTAIDAYSQIHVATALWGPYGQQWKLDEISLDYAAVPGLCVLHAVFVYPEGGCFPVSNAIEYTFTKKVQQGDAYVEVEALDSEHVKKLETDTITKCLSRLGFNADVFLRKFDDHRYVTALKEQKATRQKAAAEAAARLVTDAERKCVLDYLSVHADKFSESLRKRVETAADDATLTVARANKAMSAMRKVVRKMTKSPPEKLHGKIHALGTALYGDEWDAKRHGMVSEITNGLFESMTDMSPDQLSTLCERLEAMSQSTLEPSSADSEAASKVFHKP